MLKLIQTDWGVFDLAVDDPALGDVDAAVATLIWGVLFTDAEAPARRVPERFDRRGWFADPEAGSGLWHVRRQPLHGAARREALEIIRTALLARSAAFSDLVVAEVQLPSASGSVSSVVVEVSGAHNGRKFVVRAPL